MLWAQSATEDYIRANIVHGVTRLHVEKKERSETRRVWLSDLSFATLGYLKYFVQTAIRPASNIHLCVDMICIYLSHRRVDIGTDRRSNLVGQVDPAPEKMDERDDIPETYKNSRLLSLRARQLGVLRSFLWFCLFSHCGEYSQDIIVVFFSNGSKLLVLYL